MTRGIRLFALGWLFNVKMLTRSSFNGVLGIVYPVFLATVAFFMYRAGNAGALFHASLGASVMGVWAGPARRPARRSSASAGTGRSSCSWPRPRISRS